jgi:hypothetical protein
MVLFVSRVRIFHAIVVFLIPVRREREERRGGGKGEERKKNMQNTNCNPLPPALPPFSSSTTSIRV